jgi:hypothetical protein
MSAGQLHVERKEVTSSSAKLWSHFSHRLASHCDTAIRLPVLTYSKRDFCNTHSFTIVAPQPRLPKTCWYILGTVVGWLSAQAVYTWLIQPRELRHMLGCRPARDLAALADQIVLDFQALFVRLCASYWDVPDSAGYTSPAFAVKKYHNELFYLPFTI